MPGDGSERIRRPAALIVNLTIICVIFWLINVPFSREHVYTMDLSYHSKNHGFKIV
jgi:hypothetical protein